MKLLTIFDHCLFAKEMKMGNIKNEYLTLGLQLKNKGSFAFWDYLEKNIVIQGQTAIPEASSPGKRQIRPHHFYHTGPFATELTSLHPLTSQN
jgi:hypothetical protein